MFLRSAFGCHENSDPGKQIKKKDLNSSQSYDLKMFYGHAMFIGGNPERIEIFIISGLSLSRPMDTEADFNLNNVATLSFNFHFFGKKNSPANVLKRTQT